jgi:hypothetical protein
MLIAACLICFASGPAYAQSQKFGYGNGRHTYGYFGYGLRSVPRYGSQPFAPSTPKSGGSINLDEDSWSDFYRRNGINRGPAGPGPGKLY